LRARSAVASKFFSPYRYVVEQSSLLRRDMEEIDRKILAVLQEDGRLTVQELAQRIGLSVSPTWRRLKALQESGAIRRFAALLDPERVGVPAHVTLTKHDRSGIEGFERAIARRPEVLECFSTTGDADYLLRVCVPDTRSYERFLQEAIFTHSAVQHVRSNFTLREVKFTTALPL
jgi:DNA-binding Lrp family transcriptional regulator